MSARSLFSAMLPPSARTPGNRLRTSVAIAILALAIGAAECRAAAPILSGALVAGGTWTVSADTTFRSLPMVRYGQPSD